MGRSIELLKPHGMKLFVQLQDASFNIERHMIPDYILKEKKYNGGDTKQFNKGVHSGWVSKRWNKNVQKRFHRLIKTMAHSLDGKIAGINLQETAIEIRRDDNDELPSGFSFELYRDTIIQNMTILKQSFLHSETMQYANFMPGEWLPYNDQSYLRSIYQHSLKIKIAVGAPDLMPTKKGQQNHALIFLKEYRSLTTGIAVQDGNYIGETGEDRKPQEQWKNLVPSLIRYSLEELKVKYMFWSVQDPFFSHDLIPYLKSIKNKIRGHDIKNSPHKIKGS